VGVVTRWSVDIEWDEDPAATGWMVRQLPGHGRYEPTGQPDWRSTGLDPDTMYEFRVVAVDEDHGEESEKAVVRVWTLA
jgi:hypothetical protein